MHFVQICASFDPSETPLNPGRLRLHLGSFCKPLRQHFGIIKPIASFSDPGDVITLRIPDFDQVNERSSNQKNPPVETGRQQCVQTSNANETLFKFRAP